MTTASGCSYCIDGNMPARCDTDLGELFTRCRVCKRVCHGCHGTAVFPVRHHCLYCLIAALLDRRRAPVLCPGCTGVITVIDLGQEAAR